MSLRSFLLLLMLIGCVVAMPAMAEGPVAANAEKPAPPAMPKTPAPPAPPAPPATPATPKVSVPEASIAAGAEAGAASGVVAPKVDRASEVPAPSAATELPKALPSQLGKVLSYGEFKATVAELEQLPFIENKFSRRYKYDKFENPKLKQLRTREKLDKIVEGAADEFDAQVKLLDWSYNRFKKFGKPTSDAHGALEILDAIDQGNTFFCMHYARLFVSAAASMGYIARPVALKRIDDAPGSTEHSITEIWSNQYKKWVMFDPTYALYVQYKGVPLDSWQLRQRWLMHDGEGLEFVIGSERKKYTMADLPVKRAYHPGFGDLALSAGTLNKFAMIGYIPNTDLMDSNYDWGGMFISRDKLCEKAKWHNRDNPMNPAVEPYFPLNQAAMTLTPATDGVCVEIASNTPNFDHYEYRIDGGDWKKGRPERWAPSAGRHTLEIVALNKFDVRGPVSRLVLEVEPAKK